MPLMTARTRGADMFYFAYGSNMDHHQMLVERCPGARFVGTAVLDDYWLFFDGYSARWGGAVANIDSSPDDEVCGGLFEITAAHLQALDACEGYSRYYSRKLVDVKRPGEVAAFKAWTYLRESHPTGTPSREFILAVVQGARDCLLPEDYIHAAFDHYLRISGS